LALHNAGLKYIEIPYNPYSNKKDEHANGEYINFLQMQQAIVISTFGIKVDITAYSLPLISEHSLPTFQSKVYH
jgi:agmatine deiminase